MAATAIALGGYGGEEWIDVTDQLTWTAPQVNNKYIRLRSSSVRDIDHVTYYAHNYASIEELSDLSSVMPQYNTVRDAKHATIPVSKGEICRLTAYDLSCYGASNADTDFIWRSIFPTYCILSSLSSTDANICGYATGEWDVMKTFKNYGSKVIHVPINGYLYIMGYYDDTAVKLEKLVA